MSLHKSWENHELFKIYNIDIEMSLKKKFYSNERNHEIHKRDEF